MEISDEDGNTLCEGNALEGNHTIEIPRTGDYTILVWGRRASGGFAFVRASADAALPPEDDAADPAPEIEPYSEIESAPSEEGSR